MYVTCGTPCRRGDNARHRAEAASRMKPEFNLPNIITASRIILTPAFIVLLVSDHSILVQLSAAVFIVAAISDWYDGWYARKYNAMSAFGRFFDPLADKVLVGSAFFAFVFLGVL